MKNEIIEETLDGINELSKKCLDIRFANENLAKNFELYNYYMSVLLTLRKYLIDKCDEISQMNEELFSLNNQWSEKYKKLEDMNLIEHFFINKEAKYYLGNMDEMELNDFNQTLAENISDSPSNLSKYVLNINTFLVKDSITDEQYNELASKRIIPEEKIVKSTTINTCPKTVDQQDYILKQAIPYRNVESIQKLSTSKIVKQRKTVKKK
jgi:hypothetical protein